MNLVFLTSLSAAALLVAPVLAEVPNPGRESPPAGIEDRAIAVGAAAPDFTLDSAGGGDWSLSRALARGPVVLVFYRGDW